MPRRAPEPGLLQRLRRAIELTGLTADRSAADGRTPPFLASGRLAQMAIDHLAACSPTAGDELLVELQSLAGPAQCELLRRGRGYTFYHVIQFLYEFARRQGGLPPGRSFCLEVGRAGGGLNINPERDVSSLVRLLVAGMPPGDDGRSLGLILERLGPMMAEKVFPGGLFRLQVRPGGTDWFRVGLEHADPAEVERGLGALGLGEDVGGFFLNSAWQVQGTVQLGMDIIVADGPRHVRMHGLIESGDEVYRAGIQRSGACWWRVEWDPQVRLRRLRTEEEMLAALQTVYETMHQRELEYFQERVRSLEHRVRALEAGDRLGELVGGSSAMQQVYRMIRQVAATDLTVLVRGESGTGKELVARAIHASSGRRDRPFVAVNCAAFSATLLESELFGHEKGAFTGADRARPGRFELADGGTLFLDEVGDIPLGTQVKLLRVLETRTFERVGSNRPIEVDLRFVGATNRDLEDLIARGQVREDFFFRLDVLPVHLPALRAHREDIPALAGLFLEEIGRRSPLGVASLSPGALERLLAHPWPGNVRELRHVLERAAVFAAGPVLTAVEIGQALGGAAPQRPAAGLNLRQREVLRYLQQAGRGCRVEEIVAGVSATARGAGLSLRTLQNDLRRLSEMGYTTWVKHGSARQYVVTTRGMEQVTV